MSQILIKNATVATLNYSKGAEDKFLLKDHCILIENGKIVKLENISSFNRSFDFNSFRGEIIDAKDRLVVPGFINAHMHFYSSFACGLTKANPSKNFTEVLENLWWRLDKKLTKEMNYYSAIVAMINAIRHGTTTLIDHHASPYAISGSLLEIARAANDASLRVNLCYELSDRDGQKISDIGFKENVDFINWAEKQNGPMVKALFGLHASFTLEEKTLQKVSEFINSKGNGDVHEIGVHVHCAEDIADQKITKEKFNKSVIQRLYDHKLLNEKTICAHCIHLSDHELDLIKETNAIIVHNPQSNMNNAVGVANIIKMFEKGILVGLGTDAMTTNMLNELRFACFNQKLYQKDPSSSFMEAVTLLFKNNQEIARRFWNTPDECIGVIRAGAKADIAILDYFGATPLDSSNLFGHLLFGASESNVWATIANGRLLYKNGEFKTIDVEKIYYQSKLQAEKLWASF